MQIQPFTLKIEGASSFVSSLNQAMSFIVREINKIQAELNKAKVATYTKAIKKYHPLKGSTALSFRTSYIKLSPRATEPSGINVLFVDEADGKLKFKDGASVVTALT